MKSLVVLGKNLLGGPPCLWVYVPLVPAAFPSANMTHEMTQIANGLCYYVTFSKSPFCPCFSTGIWMAILGTYLMALS